MAKQGRAGAALAIAALGSFIGGTVATLVLVVAAPPLSRVALSFGPPEFFALMVLGLTLVVGLGGGSLLTGLLSALLGLALAMPGADLVEVTPRLTFGSADLLDGVSFVPVIMGLYGIGEILANLDARAVPVPTARIDATTLTRREARDSVMPIARGTMIGVLLGLIPGIGTILPTIVSYAVEKRVPRHPERFGRGAIEGVAGPEATNNAYANGALIPLFTLGVPASPTIAVLLGAFMTNGLTPGPFLFKERPDFVWAVIASLYVGNVMLLVLNLPLVGLWVRLLRVPYSILFPLVLAFTRWALT
jgi:putative tricarboxylic transport membrane protein